MPPIRAPRRRLAACVLALVATAAAAACTPAPPQWDPTDRSANDFGWGAVMPSYAGVSYEDGESAPVPDVFVPELFNVTLGVPADARRADIYLPTAGGQRGVIVFVHGGGFVSGSRSELGTYAGPLLRQLERGFAVMTIDYSFDPFPAAVLDVDAAVRFARSAAGAELGIPSAKVIVVGHSAGGTIAADFALAADRGDVAPYGEISPIDAWVTIGAPLDLSPSTLGGIGFRASWQAGSEPAASPLELLSAEDPPGLLIHGDTDPIVDDAHMWAMLGRSSTVGHGALSADHVSLAPPECRGHLPMCGASMAGFDRFIDAA